jgi:hypothetical protein
VVEAKLGTCAANIRYSGDHVLVKGYLEDKFVAGTGVFQLLNSIKKIGGTTNDLPDYLVKVIDEHDVAVFLIHLGIQNPAAIGRD